MEGSGVTLGLVETHSRVAGFPHGNSQPSFQDINFWPAVQRTARVYRNGFELLQSFERHAAGDHGDRWNAVLAN